MSHLRKYALIYGLLAWSVFGMLTVGGGPGGSSSEFARSTR